MAGRTLFVVLLGLHLVLLAWFHTSGVDLQDEGAEVSEVFRIMAGQVPYRDFLPVYIPLVKYGQAAVLRAVDGGLVTLRRLTFLPIAAVAILGFMIGRRVMPGPYAAAAAVLGIADIGFPLYAYGHPFATVLSLLAVWLALDGLWGPAVSTRSVAVIGLVAGLTGLIHWPLGVMLVVGLVASALVLRTAGWRQLLLLGAIGGTLPAAYIVAVALLYHLPIHVVLRPAVVMFEFASSEHWERLPELFRVPLSLDAAHLWVRRFKNYMAVLTVLAFWATCLLRVRYGGSHRLLVALSIVQAGQLLKWVVDGGRQPLFHQQIAFILAAALAWRLAEGLAGTGRQVGRVVAAGGLLALYAISVAPWTLMHVMGRVRSDHPVIIRGERLWVDPYVGALVDGVRDFFAGPAARGGCIFLGRTTLLQYVIGARSPLPSDRLEEDSRLMATPALIEATFARFAAAGGRWVGVVRQPANFAWPPARTTVDQLLSRDYTLVHRVVGRPAMGPEVTEWEIEIFERGRRS